MKILLHICCGVCLAGSSEQLLAEGHQLTGFFFNPNVKPFEEYSRRLEAASEISAINNIPVIVPDYHPEIWLDGVSEFTQETEGGRRCEICFRIRLQSTYDYMCKNNFEAFTTTLTIGPQKSPETINRIGKEIGGNAFLVRDFKKRGGYQRAVQLAKQHQIYRQNYCGCVYSIRNT
jgi:predicted adenine nucleotide alpha hydrolase (AANH) superfamily ATPase